MNDENDSKSDENEKAPKLGLADLKRLADAEDPSFPQVMRRFLDEPDPEVKPRPSDYMGTNELRSQLAQARRRRTKAARKKASTEVWQRFMAQKSPLPPRFAIAELLVGLYNKGTPGARALVFDVIDARYFPFGVWGGIKRILKIAEDKHDAAMWGALAAVFNSHSLVTEGTAGGSKTYLGRRAWRWLRDLGHASPELYPWFAVEALRRLPDGWSTLLSNVERASQEKGWRADKKLAETWKASPAPLMLLVESCQSDPVAQFAVRLLKQHHPTALKNPSASWLARLVERPIAALHDLVVESLKASPDFQPSKLKAAGLHDAVLLLLRSPSNTARAYAIEYARAHGADLSNRFLVDLLSAPNDTVKMAAEMLAARPPRDVGAALLVEALAFAPTNAWAHKALLESFSFKELPEPLVLELFFGQQQKFNFLKALDEKLKPEGGLPTALVQRALADPRCKNNWQAQNFSLELLKRGGAARIDMAWALELMSSRPEIANQIAEVLSKADSLPGLDVEKLKGFVFDPRLRWAALAILQNRKAVPPKTLGLPWLLALARRSDQQLHNFAHRTLLEHMRPTDFAPDGVNDRNAGIDRLFKLATGKDEPDPVRLFAQSYLRCHHPGIGEQQAEAKQIGLKPQLDHEAYSAARVWPALFDLRDDVRRFAVILTKAELRLWGYQTRLLELVDVDAKDVRNVALDAMLKADDPAADPMCTLKVEELTASLVFPLTESPKRQVREAGMELIRKHYKHLGGKERLAWLMSSADREVRLFAVRLLWEKHRPRPAPKTWKPTAKNSAVIDDGGRFEDAKALSDFLRRVLFGLPPGRSMEQKDAERSSKRVPASVAKRHVIEVMRDLAVEDRAFADAAAPVLVEFTASLAQGEWQACLSALLTIERAHDAQYLPKPAPTPHA